MIGKEAKQLGNGELYTQITVNGRRVWILGTVKTRARRLRDGRRLKVHTYSPVVHPKILRELNRRAR